MAATPDDELANLRQINAELEQKLDEALAREAASAEVLQVINSSPGDLAPVFDAMLEKAMRLCEAAFGTFALLEGGRLGLVAHRSVPPELVESLQRIPLSWPPLPGGHLERIAKGETVVPIDDFVDTDAYRAQLLWAPPLVDKGGARTAVWVALRKEDQLLGVLVIYRREVRPFTEKQIALLENFAAQAVIAMENARLLGELRQRTGQLEQSLEYQTATSDVLQVISRSTFDLQPVLDTLCETAVRLCDADFGALSAHEGDAYRVRATSALVSEFDQFLRGQLFTPSRATVTGRALLERQTVHIPDAAADPELLIPEAITIGRLRTMLGVPLLREGAPMGVFVLSRHRVEPFTERQIELVCTFADQAVIAIENTRLLTETREALEQQTATAEVLSVINSSPGDLEPVFDAILEKAMRLCGAAFGGLFTFDGKAFPCAALRGLPPALVKFFQVPFPASGPAAGDVVPRIVAGEEIIQIEDLTADDAYRAGHVGRRLLTDVAGARTMLWVALRKEGRLLGVLVVYRQEVRRFADTEVGLLQSFAAQAVIAMENAGLLNQIRQAQAELRATFDNMGDGVAMFDADFRIAAWNQNFQTLLDLPDEFLAARPSFPDYFEYLAARGEYTSADLEAEIRRMIERSDPGMRLERARPDGRVIEVRRNAVPDGGFVLIYSDITERKRSEAEIRAARDAAEAAYRDLKAAQASLVQAEKMASLGQLTAGIAHEIKNPLNFVNNFAELSVGLLDELKETAAPAIASLAEETRAEVDEVIGLLTGNLEKIAEHGRRADGIVKSMLEHSRGSSGERRAVDINGLVEEALNLAFHGARARDQSFNITLERDFASSLPAVELAPQDITRVCLNLFSNGFYAAIKRGKDEGDPNFEPTLKVTTRHLGEAVEIRIRDNGIGIPPESKDKLFQPFFTTKPTGQGTGLGLSISYDIVTQQHGGSIDVDTRVNEFTEFRVRLPHVPRTRLARAAS